MIVLGAGFECDVCGDKVTGVVGLHLFIKDGRPAGTALAPQLPAGWEAFADSAIVVTPSQLAGPAAIQIRCAGCALAAAGKRAS